ncbi:hypothetical protein FOCC_FOCC013152, partial [Frankliniella occidentalis]
MAAATWVPLLQVEPVVSSCLEFKRHLAVVAVVAPPGRYAMGLRAAGLGKPLRKIYTSPAPRALACLFHEVTCAGNGGVATPDAAGRHVIGACQCQARSRPAPPPQPEGRVG